MTTGGRNMLMTTGVDTEEMLLIHRVIRRELGLAPRLVRGAAGDPAWSSATSWKRPGHRSAPGS